VHTRVSTEAGGSPLSELLGQVLERQVRVNTGIERSASAAAKGKNKDKNKDRGWGQGVREGEKEIQSLR
jgi:hypothetical protein